MYMSIKLKANKQNTIVNSPAFPKLLLEYNEEFKFTGGKVNNKRFFDNVVKKYFPKYSLQGWYTFLKRYYSQTQGLIAAEPSDTTAPRTADDASAEVQKSILSNDEATRKGISLALNIGTEALQQLIEHPESFSPRERAQLLFQAMRAQDSRIFAIGKLKEDKREEDKFNRVFKDSLTE